MSFFGDHTNSARADGHPPPPDDLVLACPVLRHDGDQAAELRRICMHLARLRQNDAAGAVLPFHFKAQ
jgi:hypothetical protein